MTMTTTKISKLLRLLIGLASLALGVLIILVMLGLLLSNSINKLLVFFILLLALELCAPFLQRKINNLIKINISPVIYLIVAFILLITGFVIGSPTEEQAKQIEMQQAAEEKEKADKAAAKEREKAEKQAARDRENAKREAERKERELAEQREYNTSTVVLITNCQLAIQPNLKNPRSMDVDMQRSKVGTLNGGLGVDLYYYAENSFGGTIMNMAQCEFNNEGVLLRVRSTQ